MEFKDLHEQEKPLLICNVWDVASARMAESLQFKAIATSSSAMAAVLGYEDGEEMLFEELVYMVGRIAASIQMPLSVDLEGGYARDAATIFQHVERLHALGVVGINFEDSVVEEGRRQLEAEDFAKTLQEVKAKLVAKGIKMFFNVRTDAFILGKENALDETLYRLPLYKEAGADGIFIPYLQREDDIQALVGATTLPINVLNKPGLPSLGRLGELGIKRVSMGNGFFDAVYRIGGERMAQALAESDLTLLY